MDVKVHEVLAILGPNGAGKTTLLKCINGLLKKKIGIIMVDEEDLSKLTKTEVAKRIGYVPQRAEVPKITVFDSVLLGRKPHITWDASTKDIQIAKDVVSRLGLDALSLKYIDEISGGELQKVQIARALVQEPKVLLLDEPTSNLDLCNQHRIMATLVDVVKRNDLAAIMTMHDLNLAMQYSDKFILLKEGKIFAAGSHEIITPKNIGAVYNLSVSVANYLGRPIIIPI
ncbi:ABC transporter ATP-binding protein [Candidatus Bathyarchaeota archaeon A05DMB-2]|jgi:iron complex transport system ATP-binding protein|nr:ABC transporter ATP-binding protein [Candidatus Bathyarchaeota archaeon A05DMB-2]